MGYTTIKEYGKDSFEEKKSEFIGYTTRVENEEEARDFINKVKGENKQARHNCYAYCIGSNCSIQRYSDDGEPQGTAGIPILEVIRKNNLTDCVIVVTRYFGGILLGTGGLTRAYTQGAAIAIKSAGIIEKVKGKRITISLDYDMLGKVQYLCTTSNYYVEDTLYEGNVKLILIVESERSDEVIKEITNITSGKAVFKIEDEKDYFKEDNKLY